jgi:hypothetical protein
MSFSHHAHDAGAESSGAPKIYHVNDSETDEGSNPTETSTIVTNYGVISNVSMLSSLPLHSAVVTKRRKVSANAVTPSSGNKAIKIIYGTGPPRRGTMPHVSIQSSSTSNIPASALKVVPFTNQQETAEEPTNGPNICTVRFIDEANNRVAKNQEANSPEHPKNSLYPFPGSYNTVVVKDKLKAHKNDQCKYIIWDLRGWDETFFATNPMPSSFCPHCCCPPLICHVRLFSWYCQPHAVNDLHQLANQMTVKQAKFQQCASKLPTFHCFKIME